MRPPFKFLDADAERLLAHDSRLTLTSLPIDSFTWVGYYVFPFLLLVSPTRLPTNSFTRVGHSDMLLFDWLVSLPGLPTDSFTWVRRSNMFPIDVLESSPTLPAYPFTSLAHVRVVCSQNRMT